MADYIITSQNIEKIIIKDIEIVERSDSDHMPIETKLICKKKRSEKLENKLKKKTDGMRN